jgi:hypothetical protein
MPIDMGGMVWFRRRWLPPPPPVLPLHFRQDLLSVDRAVAAAVAVAVAVAVALAVVPLLALFLLQNLRARRIPWRLTSNNNNSKILSIRMIHIRS